MKSKLIKKSIALLTCAVVGFSILPAATANALTETEEASSRSIISKPKISFDQASVEGGEKVKVTVTFTDTMVRKVPFEIELTKGAIFLANSTADVEFVTNNIKRDVSSVTVNDDGSVMNLETGTCYKNKRSSFSFEVEAPIDSRTFQVILNTDSTHADYKQVISDNMIITSGLTIEAPDIVNDVDPFDVSGLATYKGQTPPADSHMFMEIVNKDPDKPYFHEVQLVEPIVNNEYIFKQVKLPSEYDDGEYIIKVYLYDDGQDKLIGYVEKDVQFIKKPDILQKSIYCQQRGVYATINDPLPEQGVTYKGLYVYPANGWYVPNDNIHGDHNIQAKAVLKSAKEAKEATNAKFVVTTSFGDQVFNAVKSGTTLRADLRPLRMQQTVTVNGVTRRPFINLIYDLPDGTTKTVYIGDLEPILDPSGYVFDAETKEPVTGATITLFRKDEATEDWIEWVDPTGHQENPQVTDLKGRFGWDVENGEYEVRVYHPNYHQKGEFYSTLEDPDYGVIEVPPERSDIMIPLKKPVRN